MLQEFTLRQPAGRKWFSDPYFDLILQWTEDGELLGFQLCYAVNARERSLAWHRDNGYGHYVVDTGYKGSWKSSAMLRPAPDFPKETVAQEFAERSATLPEEIRELVARRVAEAPTFD